MVFTRAAAIAFASSAAMAVVLASSLAVAHGTTDSDGDGVPDDLETATQRTVAVSTAGDEFNAPSRDSNVTLNVTVVQRFERIDNIVLTPMEARLDIGVNPAVVPPGAILGLVLRMDTRERVTLEDHSWDEENHFAPDEREINVTASGQGHSSTVFFSWSNTALADGSPIPVALMNAPTQPSPYDLTLTYAFGSPAPSTQVLQHATLGVRSTVYEIRRSAPGPGPQGDFVLYVATFAGATAFVVMTIVIANRRRSRKT